MKKSQFIEVLKELIQQELNEMNVTGAIAPIATPFAFSKGKKDNRAVKTMKGFGYTKAERPKRPSSTKLVDYRQ
jgi:hypothetical protein